MYNLWLLKIIFYVVTCCHYRCFCTRLGLLKYLSIGRVLTVSIIIIVIIIITLLVLLFFVSFWLTSHQGTRSSLLSTRFTGADDTSHSHKTCVSWVVVGVIVALWQWMLLCVLHWCDGDSANVGVRGPAVTTPPPQCSVYRHRRNYTRTVRVHPALIVCWRPKSTGQVLEGLSACLFSFCFVWNAGWPFMDEKGSKDLQEKSARLCDE